MKKSLRTTGIASHQLQGRMVSLLYTVLQPHVVDGEIALLNLPLHFGPQGLVTPWDSAIYSTVIRLQNAVVLVYE